MATTEAQSLLTAEQYETLPDDGRMTELVRGRVVEMNMPNQRHGEVCLTVGYIVKGFVKQHDLGRAVGNDSAVITERNPDSVRGADVAYYSYARFPKGPLPDHYIDVPPDVVFEVLSPSDRWPKVMEKAAEYLNAGVRVVCVLDSALLTIHVQSADRPPQTLGPDDELFLPEIADSFRLPVRQFFE